MIKKRRGSVESMRYIAFAILTLIAILFLLGYVLVKWRMKLLGIK